MDIENKPLPPQEYVVHENNLYRIQWKEYSPKNCYYMICSPTIPPRRLIVKDDRTFWITQKGTIFSSNTEKRDIKIISLVDFYKLTDSWNIPITNFALNNIPLL